MARLIGTAGHVDHGKTSLIRALTGTDADRLPEEKARGLTIDLGFAAIEMPGLGRVSIVDVPGHERFVTNMLVGALGTDVAILCIAADEGVMPQTREHMAILQLLPISAIVVALTKADAVDEEWLELAGMMTQEWLEETRFADSPIVPVSAHTGAGLDDLREHLREALDRPSPRASDEWRLPVDRAFIIKGHGVVLTGTLMGGPVAAGAEVQIEPGGLTGRVKNIQSHEDRLDKAEPGQRTALNVSGVKSEDVRRGMLAGKPGTVVETDRLDLSLTWVRRPKHASQIRLAIGAEDVVGRVFLNDHDESLAQVVLDHKVGAAQGLPVILRRHSPADLLGGGRVASALAEPRRKSAQVQAWDDQAALVDQIADILSREALGIETEDICRRLGRTRQALGESFEQLAEEGRAISFAGWWTSPAAAETAGARLLEGLAAMHKANPAVPGHGRAQAAEVARLNWPIKPLERLVGRLAAEGRLRVAGARIALPDFQVELPEKQRAMLDRVIAELEAAGVAPPRPDQIAEALNVPPQAVEQVIQTGLEAGMLVRVDDIIFYTPKTLAEIRAQLAEKFGSGSFKAAEFRDAVGASRKYVIPLLEHFDAAGFTQRLGDVRRLTQRG